MEVQKVGLQAAVTQAAKIHRPNSTQDRTQFPNPSETTGETASQRNRPVEERPRISPQQDSLQETTSELPLSILKDVQLTHAEWAWRRVVNDVLAASRPGLESSSSNEVAVSDATKGLWNLLDGLSASADGWQVVANLPGAISPSQPLISFSEIQHDAAFNALPDILQQWILRDRVVHGVSDQNGHIQGEGLFLPQSIRSEKTASERPRRWVRWQGERQSRVESSGVAVHRIQLALRVGEAPCRVEMICAKPWLAVHVGANDEQLRLRIKDSGEHVRAILSSLGWTLERWTVGPLGEGKSEG